MSPISHPSAETHPVAPAIASPSCFIAGSSGVTVTTSRNPGWRSHMPSLVKVWLVMNTVGWILDVNR